MRFSYLFILRGDLLYVLPCAILFLCFSVLLALRLPRLENNLTAFRMFDRFVLVWIWLDVWEGLRFVIVTLTPWTFLLNSYIG